MKNIIINGTAIETNFIDLAALCMHECEDPDTVATAVNGLFVQKTARANTMLNDGDSIEIVAPLQGG